MFLALLDGTTTAAYDIVSVVVGFVKTICDDLCSVISGSLPTIAIVAASMIAIALGFKLVKRFAK